MTSKEKAEIILEELNEYIQIDWNLKEIYLKAIEKGLKEIKREEGLEND